MPNEDTEYSYTGDSHNEDDLHAFVDQLFGQTLGQARLRFRGSSNRSPTLFRKGFRNFSQRHRWERKYYRRYCLSCNAQFVLKKQESAVPTSMDDLWQDVADHEEGLGETCFPERQSDIVAALEDLSGVSKTESEAADDRITDKGNPADLEGFCQRCQTLRNTPNHSTPLPIAAQEEDASVTISEVARHAVSDSPLHQSHGGLGNIPTLEEAVRRQHIHIDQDDDPDREPLWKSLFECVVEGLRRLIGRMIQHEPQIFIFIVFDDILLSPVWAIAALFAIFPLDLDRFGLGILLELFDNLTFRFFYFVIRSIVDFSLRQLILSFLGVVMILCKMTFYIFTLLGGGLVFSIAAGLQLLDDSIYFLRKCTFPNVAGISYRWLEMTSRIRYDVRSDWPGISSRWMFGICN